MPVPTHLLYTADHEWLAADDHGEFTVGITDYATDALGDVVFVELPEPGSSLTAGEPCGEIESTKSVSDLFAPADGQVTAINQAVLDAPDLLNQDPFGAAWLFRMSVTRRPELLDAAAYQAVIDGA